MRLNLCDEPCTQEQANGCERTIIKRRSELHNKLIFETAITGASGQTHPQMHFGAS